MELSEILAQPEGFTPPSATVKIKKVWPRKSGENNNGPWSYQNVEVEGGRLKLKNLPVFPLEREGQTVTLKANQSKQHGLTGIKVNHEQYNGNTYHQLVITNSCKWEWGPSQNGASTPTQSPANHAPAGIGVREYMDHLLSCAAVTNQVTELLGISDEQAMQACFATVCIDTKNRGVLLPKNLPGLTAAITEKSEQGDPYEDAPKSIVDDADLPPDYDDDIPF